MGNVGRGVCGILLILAASAGIAGGTRAGVIDSRRYEATRIGAQTVMDVNNAGRVIGWHSGWHAWAYNAPAFPTGPMVYDAYGPSAGSVRSLEPLTPERSPSLPFAVNEAGVIVGNGAEQHGGRYDMVPRGFVSRDGGMTTVDGPHGPPHGTRAYGINDAGVVVGSYELPGRVPGQDYLPMTRAFVMRDGQVRELRLLGGYQAGASDINNRGQIVGSSTIPLGGPNRAFLTTDEPGAPVVDLGAFGGGHSWASAINDRGQVVGASTLHDGYSRAFLHENGKMINLGIFGDIDRVGNSVLSHANDINEAGQVVGMSTAAYESGDLLGWEYRRAFLYEDGAMIDLNDLVELEPGWVLTDAKGINDWGAIVVQGRERGGYEGSFLLTPKGHALPTPPQVPEPTTVVVLAAGLALWAASRGRTRRN